MKKVFKILGFSLLFIILTGLVASYFGYKNYWAKDPNVKVIPENVIYFSETYEECRENFRKEVAELSGKYDSVELGSINVASEIDSDLTVDWCYIPAQKEKQKLVVLNSGLHGIEGYTGNAIQLMFIEEVLKEEQLDNIGILFIHGINPYGFKYRRKVTENNVDLNRNCVVDQSMYAGSNEGYGKLTSMLMPDGEVSLSNLRNQFFYLVAIAKIVKESMPVLRQAALQGQYQYPGGIYYGGTEFEPQMKQLKPLLIEKINNYQMLVNVDLHTAYGERGTQHLFLNPVEDEQVMNGIETIFEGEKIDWGGGDDFYTINGEYVGWVESLTDKFHIPMLLEYGTLDSQTTFGSLKSIQVMINENQGAHYGYKKEKFEAQAKGLFNEMYYPTSEVWRSKVIGDANAILNKMMTNLKEYSIEE